MAKQVGSHGHVYAFELHPDNSRRCHSNLWWYRRRVTVENMAVSDGTIDRLGVYAGRNRSGAEWNVVGQGAPELYMRAISLDHYFPAGAPTIDLVKIDVEGAGHAVLSGMARIIAEWRPLIVMEVDNDAEWKALKDLEPAGYRLITVDGQDRAAGETFGFHSVAIPTGRTVNLAYPTL